MRMAHSSLAAGIAFDSAIQVTSAQDVTLHLDFESLFVAKVGVFSETGSPHPIGDPQIPYTVSFRGKETISRHDAALQQNPSDTTINNFLQLLGRKFSELPTELPNVVRHPTLPDTPAYRLHSIDHSQGWPSRALDHIFTPTEVTTIFIKSLVHSAENSLGKWIRTAVITPPDEFCEPQRTALNQAAERAGLRILDPPASAVEATRPSTPPTLGFTNIFHDLFQLSPPRKMSWAEGPMMPRSANDSPFREDDESDWEGSTDGDAIEADSPQYEEEIDQPSLDISEAMLFMTSERLKLAAAKAEKLEGGSPVKVVVKRPRNRRRKRPKIPKGENSEEEKEVASSSSPSSPTRKPRNPASTPARTKPSKHRRRASSTALDNPRLGHSKSTPNLPSANPTLPADEDPRKLQLRSLIFKLRVLFPQDAPAMNAILANLADTDKPPLPVTDTLVHVFIDHSNILIGLLNFVDRQPNNSARKGQRHISHAALALVLERGRLITRRHIVASSPLHQDMDTARVLGYDVRVYARVPDTGDGADRRASFEHRSPKSHHSKGHVRNMSNTSTDSDTMPRGSPMSIAQVTTRVWPPVRPSIAAVAAQGSGSGRVRYREQGVDELLQLKLHQAIADVDVVPPGSVIVLATGDGNIGQFDDEGFLGPIRTALKKGWNVELYAWEKGLSKAWMQEFGDGPWKDRFRIIALEKFGADLLAIY